MTAWLDPADDRVYVAVADAVVLRLTRPAAAQLRDDLARLLGSDNNLPGGPVRHGDARVGTRRTAPTGR